MWPWTKKKSEPMLDGSELEGRVFEAEEGSTRFYRARNGKYLDALNNGNWYRSDDDGDSWRRMPDGYYLGSYSASGLVCAWDRVCTRREWAEND